MVFFCQRKYVKCVSMVICIFVILNISYTYIQSSGKVQRNNDLKFVSNGVKFGSGQQKKLENCREPERNSLGQIHVETDVTKIPDYDKMYPMVTHGGWAPVNCTPKISMAILVPYRDRPENLRKFIYHLHKFLLPQKNEYKIIVVEQADASLFNRAKLMNIGFLETQKLIKTDCFIVHDLDKLPENTKHIYKCAGFAEAQHMMGMRHEQNQKKYIHGLLYNFYMGGVVSLPSEVFSKINGFSNRYWGWGREDDDLASRIRAKKIKVTFLNGNRDASYLILSHKDDRTENTMKWPAVEEVRKTMDKDGLSDIRYKLISIKDERLFIKISADLLKDVS